MTDHYTDRAVLQPPGDGLPICDATPTMERISIEADAIELSHKVATDCGRRARSKPALDGRGCSGYYGLAQHLRGHMFVFGLVVGPIIGLVLGDAVFRSRAFDPRVGVLLIALVLTFLLFAGFFALEVKLGLIGGFLLGLLLAATPESSPT